MKERRVQRLEKIKKLEKLRSQYAEITKHEDLGLGTTSQRFRDELLVEKLGTLIKQLEDEIKYSILFIEPPVGE